jgi:uncharacterized membrane protein YhaH (DUF805 family)
MKRKNLLQYFWSCVTIDYLNFNGRARRLEFWGFTLISYLIKMLTGIFDNRFIYQFKQQIFEYTYHWYDYFLTLTGIFTLLVFVPSIAVGVRRFHDVGKFGWLYIMFGVYQVLAWFPTPYFDIIEEDFTWVLIAGALLAVIWILVILFTSGDEGINKYGLDPKNPVLGDELDQIGVE